ncbi:GNAT family N-acetyltransferase [Deinococcus maricopensis]|uniref:GCN5-related N-acetyltransferase n=1 Tax=Deinococcus maricopensis (strain DSM 21211 / LMG 22137 / NRRL B-23946 / LB-34) TaxID=709986 RepID=E8U5Q5_DEIML|nr:GNAT family N-acetyltransferase [Deinococcus maricopensis]ADV66394.1 GCN5-related N-acetyltransferase [Deinococcus maricopensis DSM 21211]
MTQLTFTLRPATPADLDAVAALYTLNDPTSAISAEELANQDRDQAELGFHHARCVAEQAGRVIGVAEYAQSPGQYHPRKFTLDLIVHPDERGRGVGRALAAWVLGAVEVHGALSARANARENDPDSLAFLARRGFTESKRYWTGTLDVARADLTPYAHLEADLRARGITILSAADLAAQHPEDWRERMYALFTDIRQDVPRSEPATPISFEQYRTWILEDPGFLPDAYFLAAHGEQLLGASDLYASGASEDLFVGLTGVRRAARGQQVATALKVRAVQYARARGVPKLHTSNESGNAPILAVNDRLGFERGPALINFLKTWEDQA